MTTQKEDFLKQHAPRLIKEQIDHGLIAESVYDEMGFPKDQDSTGNDVERDFTNSQEHRQRAKSLWHPEQIKEREALIRLKAEDNHRKDLVSMRKMFRENKIAEAQLMAQLQDGASLADASIADFDKLKAALLKSFVILRRYEDPLAKHPALPAQRTT